MKRPALHALSSQGPFRADQIRPGDPYELSHGHSISCLPTGGRGAKASAVGCTVLRTDPDAESVGIDAGFSPQTDVLRAPDLSVGRISDDPGWINAAPLLAVEYADTGQDAGDLAAKIDDLLAAGTQLVWVLRLTGPRRVEIHAPGQEMRVAFPGEELQAPGILRNPVPVEALYDPEMGDRITLRNLLQRQGYDSLDEVRAQGEAIGEARGEAKGEVKTLQESILEVLSQRELAVDDGLRTAVAACQDPAILKSWLRRAVTVASASEMF